VFVQNFGRSEYPFQLQLRNRKASPLDIGTEFPQTIKAGRMFIMRLLGRVLYFGLALFLAVHCYRNSDMDIDLLAYAGNIALARTTDPVSIHATVYAQRLTPHLRGTEVSNTQATILRKRASDPYYSALYLPYFSVKPLYVAVMQLAYKLGANVVDASRIISATCYFGIATIVWIYTGSLFSGLILILPETMNLGQINEPDAMSVMILLLGFWSIFVKRKDLGTLLLLVSIWVRPDNFIVCSFVIVYLLFTGRLRWKSGAALLSLAVGSVLAISRYGYGWKALYFHTFLGGEPSSDPRFGIADYFHSLSIGANVAIHHEVPIFFLVYMVCMAVCKERNMRSVLLLVGLSSLVHFVVYPSYEARYYGLFFLTTAIAAVQVVSSGVISLQQKGLQPLVVASQGK
jgi:hypothetical protein